MDILFTFFCLCSSYDIEKDTLAFSKVDVFLPNQIYYHGNLKAFLQITKWHGPEVTRCQSLIHFYMPLQQKIVSVSVTAKLLLIALITFFFLTLCSFLSTLSCHWNILEFLFLRTEYSIRFLHISSLMVSKIELRKYFLHIYL